MNISYLTALFSYFISTACNPDFCTKITIYRLLTEHEATLHNFMSSVIALITTYRLKNKSFLITNVRKKNLAKPLYQVTASVHYNLLTDDVLIHLFVPSHPTKTFD